MMEMERYPLTQFWRHLEVRAERIPVRDSVRLYFFERMRDGRVALATNIVFETFDPAKEPGPPGGLDIPYQTAQELMDSLWDCGLRPSEGSGSAGALRAVERHRDDLKGIVDRLLDLLARQE